MKNKQIKSRKRIPALILTLAMMLSITACNDANVVTEDNTTSPSATAASASDSAETASKTFTFTVVDGDGNETVFDIETNKETVGEALLEQGLIAGEEGQYGLYVKTVNGITADYETTGTYWAFYINGEYGTTGVDVTPITEGESYSFKVEQS